MHEAIITEVRLRAGRLALLFRIAAVCGIALAGAACSQRGVASSDRTWEPKAAAAYLDRRMEWWSGWKSCARRLRDRSGESGTRTDCDPCGRSSAATKSDLVGPQPGGLRRVMDLGTGGILGRALVEQVAQSL